MSGSNAESYFGHGAVSDITVSARGGSKFTWTEAVDPHCYLYWTLSSALVSFFVHHAVSPFIFGRLLPAYGQLPKNRRMEWDSRVLSTLHSICVCHFALSALLNDYRIWTNPVTHYSHEGFVALAIAAGYMICDLVSMPFYWGGISLVSFVIHHIFVLFSAFLIIHYRAGAFFGVYRLLTEISTPALNLRWFLRVIGLKSCDRAVAASTVVFLCTFVISRYLMIPVYWYVFFSWYGSPAHLEMVRKNAYITELGIAAGLVLDVLNLVWGRAVFKLAWRTYVLVQQEPERKQPLPNGAIKKCSSSAKQA